MAVDTVYSIIYLIGNFPVGGGVAMTFSRPAGRVLHSASKPMELVFYFVACLFILGWFAPSLVGRQTGQSFVQWIKSFFTGVVSGFNRQPGSGKPGQSPADPVRDEGGNEIGSWPGAKSYRFRWCLDAYSGSRLRNSPAGWRSSDGDDAHVVRSFGPTQFPTRSLNQYTGYDNSGIGSVQSRLDRDSVGYLVVDRARCSEGRVGRAGRWYPRPGSRIEYITSGGPARSPYLEGDPRALALLMVLCHLSGQWSWKHLGIGRDANDMHGWGAAIDFSAQSVDAFNKILQVCYLNDIPVAWISINRQGNSWPMFQIRNKKKVRIDHSSQDHTSHFCFQLPRPEFVMALVPWEEGHFG